MVCYLLSLKMYKNHQKSMNKNEYISFRFNKRIVIVSDKYGYISLDGIIRSQYYYPFKNDGFVPIKCTGKRTLFK